MNGKKAKQLRRIAEMETVGLANVEYNFGGGVPNFWGPVKQRILNADCTRSVYQQLKRAA